MPLKILKTDVDGLTGHITYTVQVEEVLSDGSRSYGPAEIVGIDHASLHHKYNAGPAPTADSVEAALQAWLKDHYVGAKARKRSMDATRLSVHAHNGKTLEF